MNSISFIGLFLAAVYVSITLFGGRILSSSKLDKIWIHSFANGVLIAALLLAFFEEIYLLENAELYVCIVAIAFTVFFGLKMHAKHDAREIRKFHLATHLFEGLHYTIVGMFFARLSSQSLSAIIALGVPVLLVKASGTFEHVAGKTVSNPALVHYIVTSFVLIGFIVGQYPIPSSIFNFALAIVAGGLFHRIVSLVFSRQCVNIKAMIFGELLYGLLFVIALNVHM